MMVRSRFARTYTQCEDSCTVCNPRSRTRASQSGPITWIIPSFVAHEAVE